MAAAPAKRYIVGSDVLHILATHTCNDVIGLTTYYHVRFLVPEVCHPPTFLAHPDPPIPKVTTRLSAAELRLRLVMRIF